MDSFTLDTSRSDEIFAIKIYLFRYFHQLWLDGSRKINKNC